MITAILHAAITVVAVSVFVWAAVIVKHVIGRRS